MKENDMEPEQLKFSPENLAKLVNLAESRVINSQTAKEVFEKVFSDDTDPEKYVEENPQPVEDYHNGKKKAMGFLVGQIMKEMKGKADPAMANNILKELL